MYDMEIKSADLSITEISNSYQFHFSGLSADDPILFMVITTMALALVLILSGYRSLSSDPASVLFLEHFSMGC